MGNVGARGVATAAFTPCERQRVLALHGADTYAAAADLFGQPARPRTSNIAFQVGRSYETGLMRGDEHGPAAALRRVYVNAGLLETDDSAEDFTPPDGKEVTVGVAARAKEVFIAAANGEKGPRLLLQPPFKLGVGDRGTRIFPDTARLGGDGRWRLGDVKVYVDRDGHTSPADVAHTCQQIAVGVVAARHAFADWGLDPTLIASEGDVIFRRPGPRRATVKVLDLKTEITAVAATLDSAGDLFAAHPDITTAAAINAVPACRGAHCATSCGLVSVCQPTTLYRHLSGPVADELAAAGIDMTRAAELAAGTAALSVVEADAARYLELGWSTVQ